MLFSLSPLHRLPLLGSLLLASSSLAIVECSATESVPDNGPSGADAGASSSSGGMSASGGSSSGSPSSSNSGSGSSGGGSSSGGAPVADAGAEDASAAPTPDSGPGARRVNWYLNRNEPSANASFVSANPAALTGVYLCCNAFVFDDSGAFTSSSTDAEIQTQMAPLAALGLPISYVLSITDADLASGAYTGSIATAVETAVRNHISGYVSDYEPQTNYTLAHEEQYATFLSDMAAAMHAANPPLSFEVAVAGWGILDAWSVYAPVPVDAFASMDPTYYGTSVPDDEAFVAGEMEGGVPVARIAVGISTTEWSQADLQTFVTWLGQAGVDQIDVWRSDIDSYGSVEPYYGTILGGFLAENP
jgi:hypothetical protein